MSKHAFDLWLQSDDLAAHTIRMVLCDHRDADLIKQALRCMWAHARVRGADEMGKNLLRSFDAANGC